MTVEPTVYFQLGISDDRYHVISKEIQSIIKTNEPVGVQMEMAQQSRMSEAEKMYAAFMIAKADIQNKLIRKMPPMGKGIVKCIMEE